MVRGRETGKGFVTEAEREDTVHEGHSQHFQMKNVC